MIIKELIQLIYWNHIVLKNFLATNKHLKSLPTKTSNSIPLFTNPEIGGIMIM